MLLSIYKLECDIEEPLCSFGSGEHFIGRGPALQCSDSRISRSHAAIKIAPNNATITAKHNINPLFYRAADSTHISILKYDTPNELTSGDSFGFFPDSHWYKVTISNESCNNNDDEVKTQTYDECLAGNVSNITSEPDNVRKRSLNEPDDVTQSKVQKLMPQEPNQNEDNVDSVTTYLNDDNRDNKNNELQNHDNSNAASSTTKTYVTVKEEFNLTEVNNDSNHVNPETVNTALIKEELHDEDAPSDKGTNCTENAETSNPSLAKIKQENDNDPNAPSCSGLNDKNGHTCDKKKTFKERCWYGTNCYRRNDQHKQKFSHPGDADYDTDPEDDRPVCDFGSACYRRNQQHREDFRHPRDGAPPPQRPRPQPAQPQQFPLRNPQTTSPVGSPARPAGNRRRNGSDDDDDEDAGGVNSANILPKRQKRKRPKNNFAESPLDEYDVNDPFIDDGSEDEYKTESDSGESDM